jgi:integrase/recombinase XerD
MNDANTNYLKQHIDILSFRDLAPGTITTYTSYMTQFIEWTESLLSSKSLSDISWEELRHLHIIGNHQNCICRPHA